MIRQNVLRSRRTFQSLLSKQALQPGKRRASTAAIQSAQPIPRRNLPTVSSGHDLFHQRTSLRATCTGLQARREFSSDSAARTVVNVPSMGDSISEGTIVEWTKDVGDYAELDETVVVLETDKVSVDVRAPSAGTVVEFFGSIDDTIQVGAPLFSLDTSAAAPNDVGNEKTGTQSSPSAASTSTEQVEPTQVDVPAMGDSISEGTIVQWVCGPNDYVKADDVVAVLETDKVSVDVRAPVAGQIKEIFGSVDDVKNVGDRLFSIDPTVSIPESSKPSSPPAAPAATENDTPAPTPQPSTASPSNPSSDAVSPPSSESGRFSRKETRIPLGPFRHRTMEHMKNSQETAAMLTTFQEVDMSAVLDMRRDLNDEFRKKFGDENAEDFELSILSPFVKAVAKSLREVPAVNARIDDETNEIVYHEYSDINLTIGAGSRMVTPVIRNCEGLSFAKVEQKISELTQQAQNGSLAVEDLAGGTFTISNSGVLGALAGTGMLTSPQSGCLSINSIKMRPVEENGKLVPKPMMFISLTYDHRLIDGKEAVTFLKSVATSIADPRRLLLDV